jgi:hypothetical protein
VPGEYIEDHLGAVNDLDLHDLLQIPVLRRGEVIVKNDGRDPGGPALFGRAAALPLPI